MVFLYEGACTIYLIARGENKPTDKQWLQHYGEVKNWLADINKLSKVQGFTLEKQQANYANMGKQIIPIALIIVKSGLFKVRARAHPVFIACAGALN